MTQEAFEQSPQADEDSVSASLESISRRTSLKLLILLAIGGALLFLVHATPLGDRLRSWNDVSLIFQSGGITAIVYFLVSSSLLIMVGSPRLVFYALGGFAFGFWQGLLLSQISSLIGSFMTFQIARWGSQAWMIERLGSKRFFKRIVHAKPTATSVALVRMLPVSNGIINVGLALSQVGNPAFLLGSFIGFLPQGIVSAIIGSGLAVDVPWIGAAQIGAAAMLLLATLLWSSRKKP